MDLYAYGQIGKYEPLLKSHGITIPRLRGIRKMDEEEKSGSGFPELVRKIAINAGVDELGSVDLGGFKVYADIGSRIKGVVYKNHFVKNGNKKVFVKDDPVDIDWADVPFKKLDSVLKAMSDAAKAYVLQMNTFDKFVGHKDVYMMHARIGGGNWKDYGGPALRKQPWFICKVDDGFDSTYCDIYVDLSKASMVEVSVGGNKDA